MPLTEKEFYQIETAIECMDGFDISNIGRMISKHNVLVLISKFALLGKDKPREGCCGEGECSKEHGCPEEPREGE
jgi:hypothetical protein